eukprot:10641059-Ditylum_brightwellii.AAC.1
MSESRSASLATSVASFLIAKMAASLSTDFSLSSVDDTEISSMLVASALPAVFASARSVVGFSLFLLSALLRVD